MPFALCIHGFRIDLDVELDELTDKEMMDMEGPLYQAIVYKRHDHPWSLYLQGEVGSWNQYPMDTKGTEEKSVLENVYLPYYALNNFSAFKEVLDKIDCQTNILLFNIV